MNKELILALEELEKEKGIKKEELLESIRTALITAYKRNFDALENVDVKMDEQTGATHVFAIKEVMERANDDALEIELEEALETNKDAKIESRRMKIQQLAESYKNDPTKIAILSTLSKELAMLENK